ncbi:hypothetical protein J5N97_000170 [Dioscorea zingiberensis]|uniref:Uncharacterized protein n=1 Tax=Dioscorea zingiberensis TaxID=325984 RepID=A0A9D5BT23_9LILI|nr:hypothetical protein J5N97_000170 [Dioscorea zingiberensis]
MAIPPTLRPFPSFSAAWRISQRQLCEKSSHEDTAKQFDHVGSCFRNGKVVSFIWAVTRNTIPLDMLLGTST